ncbi:hypothetical protein C1H46_004215 [Malus baccata]|uniref:Autophagy protein ATG17-like domain-containing protein n=1 Tax=Malus baccata TaxID=106549 RepID=A0A540NGL5_MALBA|nr:hypothetical protein C1H46_004215 [Malus baccata]
MAGINLNDQLVLLQTNSSLPPPEQVDILDTADPQLPSASHDPHPLDDALDPALKALPSYERQFRYHSHKGHAIYSRTQVKYENYERLLMEQKVQERAVEVARGNLDQYYKMINQTYTEFMKRYSQQHQSHSDLLINLWRDVEKLRSVKLHPALETATWKCLSDFVKEETLRKAGEICSSSHRQFENKVSQFKQMFSEVKQKVEELFSNRASLPIRHLELTIKDHQRYIHEQKSIMQSLSKDVNTVKKLVDDCLSCQLSSSLCPLDAVSALGPMYDVHDKNHLPRMQACDHAISKLLDFCKDKKNEMNVFLHNYMQKIAYISYIIKDAKLQFPVFREAMVRQEDLFLDLKLVRGIGPAYRACLAEIVRRKASLKLYMGMAGQLAERLATKREIEVRRREEFLKDHSLYIPRDVLASMGLYDTLNQCDVNIAPFDTSLLDIEISDIDHYAPEYLTPLSSKSAFRGSYSMSNETCHSVGADESTLDNLENCDSEELLEGGELVEIAGTVDFESLDDSKVDNLLKSAAEKTTEALHLKDDYGMHLQSMLRVDDCKQEIIGGREVHMPCSSNTEPMDEVSCVSSVLDAKLGLFNVQPGKMRDGVDENMMDSSAVRNHLMDSSMQNHPLDSSMQELQREELLASGKDGKEKMVGQLGMSLTNSSTAESMPEPLNVIPCETAIDPGLNTKVSAELLLELQTTLSEKSNQLSETEIKLKATMEDVSILKRELDTNRKLLDESQLVFL